MTTDSQAQIAELRRELEFIHERDSLLMQIDAVTRVATDAAEITHSAASLLGRHLDVNCCAYAEVEYDQDNLTVIGNFVDWPTVHGWQLHAPPILQLRLRPDHRAIRSSSKTRKATNAAALELRRSGPPV
jgi:hypothetical protein